MASSEVVQDSHIDNDRASTRSPVSSVFSTGTRFSIATLPQEESQSSAPGFSERIMRSAARPQSLRTLASHEVPAPPYETCQAFEALQPSPAQRRFATIESPASLVAAAYDTPSTSPASEPENALSVHYGRVVRIIDHNHAVELTHLVKEHERALAHLVKEHQRTLERELAAVRHEVDQAYRREWKAKNREVEKFREEANARVAQSQQDASDQVAALAEAHELATDKARNAIEDLWEGRWSDRVRLATEEAQRLDLENQRRLEQAVADRDAENQRRLEQAMADRDAENQENQRRLEQAMADRDAENQENQRRLEQAMADRDAENQENQRRLEQAMADRDQENQRRLEQAVTDRDAEWAKELEKRLLHQLKNTISGLSAAN